MIRMGLVGLGGVMSGAHIPGILASPDLAVAAICDTDAAALDRAGKRLGIPAERRYRDYRELVRCGDVDAVDIATPNNVHVAAALEAVRAGKPFSCEKPLALSAREAEALASAVDKAPVPNMICFSYRYKAAARYMRELVRRGEIGEIYHVAVQYFQSWGLPSADCPLVWRFEREKTGSGALGDLGSHMADLVPFVTGLRYRKLTGHCGTFVPERRRPDGQGKGRVDVDDFVNFLAELDNGASCTFQITRLAFGRGNYQRMEVYGSGGALVYTLDEDGTGRDALALCEGAAMGEARRYTDLPVPERCRASQMQSFAELLLGRGDGLAACVADGAYNMRVMDAVQTSCRTGAWAEP